MNDNYDPNLNPDGQKPEEPGAGEGRADQPAGGQRVWNVPPQQGGSQQPPYYAEELRRPSQPPQQYSTASGWQQGGEAPKSQPQQPYQWNFEDYERAREAAPKRKRRGLTVFGAILGVIVAISLVSMASIGIYSSLSRRDAGPVASSQPQAPAEGAVPGITIQDKPADAGGQALPGGKLSSEEIIEQVAPSVVAITSYMNSRGYQAQGMGSGIIIREDGYIVTNAHVVEGAVGISVQLSDGETSYEGRVVGADQQTDLAVVKVDADGLPAAVFGNSDQVKVGEKVLAIGNPQSMEFAGSVTQGIVSGLNRQISAADQTTGTVTHYKKLIQTDAAINPGNSGGALVNEYGQVIGINSAKVIATGAEGMGFAIPSNSAKPIVDDLIAYGRVTGRVLLGITAQEINEVQARLNQVPTGLLVISTSEGTDISRKGVVPGDIITKVNDKEIKSLQDLTDEIEGKKPGDTVKLEVYRPSNRPGGDGRFFEVEIALVEDTGGSAAQDQPAAQTPQGGQYPDGQYPGGSADPFDEFFRDFFG